MGGCTAINCNNSDKKGFRMFNYPTNEERRKRWLLNTRRDKFNPTKSSQLCEIHFEESQFEKNRADGWKKLKPNAVPTLFNVPNPPPKFDTNRQSKYKDMNRIFKNTQNVNIPALQNISDPISEELPLQPPLALPLEHFVNIILLQVHPSHRRLKLGRPHDLLV